MDDFPVNRELVEFLRQRIDFGHMFETLRSDWPSHWPQSILGRVGFALLVVGGAFRFVGYGRWTLLLIVAGGVLGLVDRGLKKEPEGPAI